MKEFRVPGLVAIVALVLLLSGCTLLQPAPIPTKAEIVGTWVHKSEGGTLTFKADGEVTVSGVPEQAIDAVGSVNVALGATPKGPAVNAIGTWDQGGSTDPHRDTADRPLVYLELPTVGKIGSTTSLVVSGSGTSMQLFVILGDPDNDNNYVFVRKH
jgi:hypothetical protein